MYTLVQQTSMMANTWLTESEETWYNPISIKIYVAQISGLHTFLLLLPDDSGVDILCFEKPVTSANDDYNSIDLVKTYWYAG